MTHIYPGAGLPLGPFSPPCVPPVRHPRGLAPGIHAPAVTRHAGTGPALWSMDRRAAREDDESETLR